MISTDRVNNESVDTSQNDKSSCTLNKQSAKKLP